MDVLGVLFAIAVIGGLIAAAVFILFWAGLFASFAFIALWPALTGIGIGIYLWINGHDNLGVIAIICGLVGEVVWMSRFKSEGGGSSYDPMADKRKHYNLKGETTGYEDRE